GKAQRISGFRGGAGLGHRRGGRGSIGLAGEADETEGAAPLVVTFTLDASDADGDSLSWTFDADNDTIPDASGGSDDLPATVTWPYAMPGAYTASLVIDDGQAQDVQTLAITVE
ncbi:MAG: PKD domain-containing protein, partial [Thermoplasmatota archaeon]